MNSVRIDCSVIIPSRNRSDTLFRVLRALEKQKTGAEFEVIVVDDQSTDSTMNQLTRYIHNTALKLLCLSGKGLGAACARNIALDQAQGEWLIFLDADTIPETGFVQKHLHWLNRLGEKACVVGRNRVSAELSAEQQIRIPENSFQNAKDMTEIDWPEYRTGNSSMSRRLCVLAGGFNENLRAAEDTELAARLAQQGARFYYIPYIKTVHHHPLDLDAFFQKAALYGHAAACWYQKAPEYRRLLVYRYGVYAPELSLFKKIKYRLRSILINEYTIPGIIRCGKYLSSHLGISERLYKSVFQFHTRQAFKHGTTR